MSRSPAGGRDCQLDYQVAMGRGKDIRQHEKRATRLTTLRGDRHFKFGRIVNQS